MNKQCMVTGCQEEGTHFCFDGVFWIRVCNEHLSEFRNFSQINKLVFEVRDICLYCGFRICEESIDACNYCIKEAERKGCDVSNLPSIKQGKEEQIRMSKELITSIKNIWKKVESSFPLKGNTANDPEYCNIPVTRVVFSHNREVLDIEDIAGNNIRIVEKDEAEWLIDALQRYIKELDTKRGKRE